MTLTRANLAGWTDDISNITAKQANDMDVNITKALDGVGGGLYAPSAPVNIQGDGLTGRLTMQVGPWGPDTQFTWRTDITTLGQSQPSPLILDTSNDEYIAVVANRYTGAKVIVLNTQSGPTPVVGARIRLRFSFDSAGGGGVRVETETFAPPPYPRVIEFSTLAAPFHVFGWCEVVFAGSEWVTSAFGADTSGSVGFIVER